jgi:hypothetical protein
MIIASEQPDFAWMAQIRTNSVRYTSSLMRRRSSPVELPDGTANNDLGHPPPRRKIRWFQPEGWRLPERRRQA